MTREISDERIRQALEHCGNNLSQTAKYLGMPRTSLRRRVNALRKIRDYKPKEKRSKTTHRYVITSAQNDTDLFLPGLNALKSYCAFTGADLLIIPIRYKNVNAYIDDKDYSASWPAEIEPYKVDTDIELNKNLVVLGSLKIQATSSSPLSGLENIAGKQSAIIGHGQVQLRMVATPIYDLPKQLLTTGSVSIRNYSVSKAGKKASINHTLGATVVEVSGNTFWTRQITFGDDGSFYDLDTQYFPNKLPVSGIRAKALRCGDLHNDFLDENVTMATWLAPDSITNVCKPEVLLLDDALDFYSQNHHHRNDFYTRYAKFKAGKNNVREELLRLVDNHNSIWGQFDNDIYYVPSNHNDALTRWLNETDPKQDPENALIYHELQLAMLKNTDFNKHGACIPSPLRLFMQDKINNPERTFFPLREDKVETGDIDHIHGDKGPNGSRGTLSALSKSGHRNISGHGHSPGIEKKAVRGGTSSRLILDYNKGSYSSWMHTHVLIYPDYNTTLISILYDKWRLA